MYLRAVAVHRQQTRSLDYVTPMLLKLTNKSKKQKAEEMVVNNRGSFSQRRHTQRQIVHGSRKAPFSRSALGESARDSASPMPWSTH